jgi:hypothetical protein
VKNDLTDSEASSGVERAVIHVQTNGVQFAGGSWLYFNKAKSFRQTTNGVPNGFQVCLEGTGTFDKVMEYQIIPNTTTTPTRAEIDAAGEFLLAKYDYNAEVVIGMSELTRVWTAEAMGWKRTA